ncbi:MAG: YraN family protein [Candidatus Omnitrophica bacterium]|nr:YraN family protein [Candidatus Omnitrophota bacterium]
MSIFKQQTGRIGEDAAEAALKRDGYKILAKNFRCPFGEVDIIARDKKAICFIEVKARRSDHCGSPAEAVSRAKQEKIIKTAFFYLNKYKLDNYEVRFDVVSVRLKAAGIFQEVEIIKNAFEAGNF